MLPGAWVLQVTFEMPAAAREALLPPALHPTDPPLVSWIVPALRGREPARRVRHGAAPRRVPERAAAARLPRRVRRRLDGGGRRARVAAGAIASRPGDVRLARQYDAVTGTVACDGRTILEVGAARPRSARPARRPVHGEHAPRAHAARAAARPGRSRVRGGARRARAAASLRVRRRRLGRRPASSPTHPVSASIARRRRDAAQAALRLPARRVGVRRNRDPVASRADRGSIARGRPSPHRRRCPRPGGAGVRWTPLVRGRPRSLPAARRGGGAHESRAAHDRDRDRVRAQSDAVRVPGERPPAPVGRPLRPRARHADPAAHREALRAALVETQRPHARVRAGRPRRSGARGRAASGSSSGARSTPTRYDAVLQPRPESARAPADRARRLRAGHDRGRGRGRRRLDRPPAQLAGLRAGGRPAGARPRTSRARGGRARRRDLPARRSR